MLNFSRVFIRSLSLVLLAILLSCSSGDDQVTGDEFSNEIGSEEAVSGEPATQDLTSSDAEDLAEADELDQESPEPKMTDMEADVNEGMDMPQESAKNDFVEPGGTDELEEDEESAKQSTEVPAPMVEADTASETPPAPSVQADEEAYENQLVVTGVDFKANKNGGTLVIQANGKLKFETRENQKNNQFILELNNVQLPDRFKRPYNTSEFSGPIGMIQAYQSKGSSQAKFVVQLKQYTPMSVVPEGNALLIMTGNEEGIAQDTNASADSESIEETETLKEKNLTEQDKALSTKTLDEFLTGDTKFYGRKISIEVKDADLKEVFNLISEESGLNIILSEDIKGKTTLKLRQIPWDQALVIIMQSNQLGYVRQGNILRIAPLEQIRKETDQARQLLESQKQLEPIKARVYNLSYAKAKDLEPQIQNFLTAGRGKVKADERTNTLVVTDVNDVLAKIEKLLKKLDTQTPQVLIEAKIVEAQESINNTVGISWGNTSDPANIGLGVADLMMGRLTASSSGVIGFTAKLAMLETEQKIKILSSPRIVTINNGKANIEQIQQIPIYTTTTQPSTGQTTKSVTYKDAKLQLEVQPQITAEGGVILKLNLIREIPGPVDTNAGDTGARTIHTRKAESSVLVKSGDTTVIGGIYQSDETEGGTGIPVLRDLPLIGGLFGATAKTKDKNELLIFITPRILNKEKAFGSLSDADDIESTNTKNEKKDL